MTVEWRVEPGLQPYEDAVRGMEERVAVIRAGSADELAWLVEHPPLYTAGTSARKEDLLAPDRFPVHATGRGGEFTYHGPGQRVVYLMLDLASRGRDVRRFVRAVESWLIGALAEFGIEGERRGGRVGIWVERPGGEAKIAAVGLRLRHWISYHGVSLNVAPDLSHYDGIVPCGIGEYGVTSLADLGVAASMEEVDDALLRRFAAVFGERPKQPVPAGLTNGRAG
ncbi:MAG: lipoyl(octanoyl) transferase LipB [Defluviicoccus sp.]|nr:lipoyl(octanoyl) transferase LipB [Defluviicoccus sp.]MDE0277776.1 lipoyl(octanoyl) transferase LipB [Defluviicoccus sp.]